MHSNRRMQYNRGLKMSRKFTNRLNNKVIKRDQGILISITALALFRKIQLEKVNVQYFDKKLKYQPKLMHQMHKRTT